MLDEFGEPFLRLRARMAGETAHHPPRVEIDGEDRALTVLPLIRDESAGAPIRPIDAQVVERRGRRDAGLQRNGPQGLPGFDVDAQELGPARHRRPFAIGEPGVEHPEMALPVEDAVGHMEQGLLRHFRIDRVGHGIGERRHRAILCHLAQREGHVGREAWHHHEDPAARRDRKAGRRGRRVGEDREFHHSHRAGRARLARCADVEARRRAVLGERRAADEAERGSTGGLSEEQTA